MPHPARPVGSITRGTTHPNRLRRVDRWIAAVLGPRRVDLGEQTGTDGVAGKDGHLTALRFGIGASLEPLNKAPWPASRFEGTAAPVTKARRL